MKFSRKRQWLHRQFSSCKSLINSWVESILSSSLLQSRTWTYWSLLFLSFLRWHFSMQCPVAKPVTFLSHSYLDYYLVCTTSSWDFLNLILFVFFFRTFTIVLDSIPQKGSPPKWEVEALFLASRAPLLPYILVAPVERYYVILA